MLADPRAEALVENFAGQWLFIRALADHNPDYQRYPSFDEALRASMAAEAKAFFREFLQQDTPLPAMLAADFTYLDDRLATHYGLPPVGPDLTRVVLPTDRRGGLLKQGGLLMVTSYPTRTSPVKRGKWVLTNLLCSEPPPPPPNVEGGLDSGEIPAGSIRDRMKAHLVAPSCRACHETMDPIGFALEHYDAIGAWRDKDDVYAIDATGELPGGKTFDGAAQMSSLLAEDPRFGACAATKLFTYALGRGTTPADAPYINEIAGDFKADGSRLRDLVKLVATSEPFRLRRGEPAKAGGKP
jgi:hypothetical protein